MRLHWQNLNEKGREEVTGSIVRAGRAWLYLDGESRNSLNVEWKLWSKSLSVQLGLADYDHAISAHVCLYLFSLYVTLDWFRAERWLRQMTKRKGEQFGNGRTIGISWFDERLSVDLWNDPMEWQSSDPKWWHFSIAPADILLGKRKYSERPLSVDTRFLTLPERSYPVEIKLKEAMWKRARWPFPAKIVRAEMNVVGGVPVPGKGENSWDCGEDATFGITCPANTFDEALSAYYSSVMRSRERHGGKNWLPEADRPIPPSERVTVNPRGI